MINALSNYSETRSPGGKNKWFLYKNVFSSKPTGWGAGRDQDLDAGLLQFDATPVPAGVRHPQAAEGDGESPDLVVRDGHRGAVEAAFGPRVETGARVPTPTPALLHVSDGGKRWRA